MHIVVTFVLADGLDAMLKIANTRAIFLPHERDQHFDVRGTERQKRQCSVCGLCSGKSVRAR